MQFLPSPTASSVLLNQVWILCGWSGACQSLPFWKLRKMVVVVLFFGFGLAESKTNLGSQKCLVTNMWLKKSQISEWEACTTGTPTGAERPAGQRRAAWTLESTGQLQHQTLWRWGRIAAPPPAGLLPSSLSERWRKQCWFLDCCVWWSPNTQRNSY